MVGYSIAILIPVVILLATWVFFPHKVTWKEVVFPILACFAITLISKGVIEKQLTKDVEYWGSWITKIEYIEEWDEYIHKTCSETTTDSKGNTTTRTYDCSYVDNHPPVWLMRDSLGEVFKITPDHYAMLKLRWGNENFVEMNRDFHRIDGDAYEVSWNGVEEHIEPITTEHTWENRVQASSSVFKAKPYTQRELKGFGVHDYPEPDEFNRAPSVLGPGFNVHLASRYLAIQNAKIGAFKKVRMWVLTFKNQPLEAAMAQEAYWLGGNKNDIVLCLGTTDNENSPFAWAYVISWTPNETTKVNLRNAVTQQKNQSIYTASQLLVNEVNKSWVKKDFKEFNYLTVSPPLKVMIWFYIAMVVISVGTSIWIVNNEFTDKAVGNSNNNFRSGNSINNRFFNRRS